MTSPLDTAQARLLASLPKEEAGAAYPVERWNPPLCGHSGMRIDAEGRWHHEGALIPRAAMVALFARLLRREPDGSHMLVTPTEKLAIDVDDAPLVATGLHSAGSGRDRQVAFLVEPFGWTVAGAEHPLRVRATKSGPVPDLAGPRGLRARLARPVYYELAELALAETRDTPFPIGLWSGGVFHVLAVGEAPVP